MDSADLVSEILQARCGQLTIALLKSGARLDVHNVAWGRDMGESCDHITTNISPAPPENASVDFFHTSEVVRLEEPDGTLLYQAPDVA